jgi:hypothetical protein
MAETLQYLMCSGAQARRQNYWHLDSGGVEGGLPSIELSVDDDA